MHTTTIGLALITLALGGCKTNDEPAPVPPAQRDLPAAAPPQEGPLPTLNTGAVEIETLPEVPSRVLATQRAGAQYVALAWPSDAPGIGNAARLHVQAPRGAVGVLEEGAPPRILLRIPNGAAPTGQVEVTAFFVGIGEHDRPTALPIVATLPAAPSPATDLPQQWARALADDLQGFGSRWMQPASDHPWRDFAAGRILHRFGQSAAGDSLGTARRRGGPRTDLARLMSTTVGATSLQEALQHDRGLRIAQPTELPTISLEQLKGPDLREHPWETMQAALPKAPPPATAEPLAAATPADFWYVRFDDIRVMLRLVDEAKAWMTPVAHIMEDRAEVHALADRYERQLGLRRTGLAKALGHTVVDRVALVGSDPYLREGSDITMIFELHSAAAFDREVASHMDAYRKEVAGIVDSVVSYQGHRIDVRRDPTGTVRQYRARVGSRALVSNSLAGCEAVLDAIDGRRPRLSDSQDLDYMLARDPGDHDAFAFLSDRFIAAVTGPRQKILAARRQQALAELLTPGYAALLHGWLQGAPPKDVRALIDAGYLMPDELAHADHTPITFEIGRTPRSRWGTPAMLTPLLELDAPDTVTPSERDAYEQFAAGYENYWREFIDPIAVRLDLSDEPEPELVVDVRVLPLIEATSYRELEEVVGAERIDAPEIDDGAQLVFAVGAESGLRLELDRFARSFVGGPNLGLGWLGDWVAVGTLDRHALAEFVAQVDDEVQLPAPKVDSDSVHDREVALASALGKLPVYAAAHVRNPTSLVATLAALRGLAIAAAPGTLTWEEDHKVGDVAVVRVGISPAASGEFEGYGDAIALYYAIADDALVAALDAEVLAHVLERLAAGGGPRRGVDGGPQFVADVRLQPGHALWAAATWALQGQANRSQAGARAAAEILLRGDPTIDGPEALRAMGLAYFGSYPVTASGQLDFSLAPEGVVDGRHGSALAPRFPPLPVPGSPIATLATRVAGLRGSVAFDREPASLPRPARSLHTRVRVRLRPDP